MRFIRYVLLAISALVVIVLSVANRQPVRVNLAPDLTGYGLDPTPSYDVPLFAVALACATLGFILGAAREYLREARLRREARRRDKEIGQLKRELGELKKAQQRDEDEDILALTAR